MPKLTRKQQRAKRARKARRDNHNHYLAEKHKREAHLAKRRANGGFAYDDAYMLIQYEASDGGIVEIWNPLDQPILSVYELDGLTYTRCDDPERPPRRSVVNVPAEGDLLVWREERETGYGRLRKAVERDVKHFAERRERLRQWAEAQTNFESPEMMEAMSELDPPEGLLPESDEDEEANAEEVTDDAEAPADH